MRLVTFTSQGRTRPGVLLPDGAIVDVTLLNEPPLPTMTDVLKLGSAAVAEIGKAAQWFAEQKPEAVFRLEDVVLEAPVPRPGKIVCLGLNYREHAAEQGKEPPSSPVIFAKYATAINRHGGTIVLPPNSSKVDYEAELCVVIGKTGRARSEAEAMDFVAGYTIINDVSARDMQFADKQFVRSKSCDTFAPTGPWIVLKEDIPDPHALAISLALNGETMQSSNTNQLIFRIPFIIAYLSQSMTFEAGDLIATGTPSGVGFARNPPVFLKAGDVVEVTIEGIGTLRNTVAEEAV